MGLHHRPRTAMPPCVIQPASHINPHHTQHITDRPAGFSDAPSLLAMEVVLCSLWLGRRLRSAVWGSGGGTYCSQPNPAPSIDHQSVDA